MEFDPRLVQESEIDVVNQLEVYRDRRRQGALNSVRQRIRIVEFCRQVRDV